MPPVRGVGRTRAIDATLVRRLWQVLIVSSQHLFHRVVLRRLRFETRAVAELSLLSTRPSR
jgi:hypothetical protein